MARAAEFNGIPGPAHVLELKQQLGLSISQFAAIAAIRDQMPAKDMIPRCGGDTTDAGKTLSDITRADGQRFEYDHMVILLEHLNKLVRAQIHASDLNPAQQGPVLV
ncbi:MAG: hypothetical protein AAFW74_00975 [Pseudomonadota bacterium]